MEIFNKNCEADCFLPSKEFEHFFSQIMDENDELFESDCLLNPSDRLYSPEGQDEKTTEQSESIGSQDSSQTKQSLDENHNPYHYTMEESSIETLAYNERLDSTNSPQSEGEEAWTCNRHKIKASNKIHRVPKRCDICNRMFSDAYNLKIHMMKHNNEYRYKCNECGREFRQKNKLEMHLVVHTKAKPFTCDLCGKSFRFRDYLAVHKRRHSEKYLKLFECEICQADFTSKNYLLLHMENAHKRTTADENELKRQTISCPIAMCGKVFAANSSLAAHLKRAHLKRRDYKCDECAKSFFEACHLREHKLTHTNEKSFSCTHESCKASFQRKSQLTQHLKLHSVLKSYHCKICGKNFSQSAGLSAHKRTHRRNSAKETKV